MKNNLYQEYGNIDWTSDNLYLRDLNDDVKQLRIREYLDIENRAKEENKWLRMNDGTLWLGDPKTWVHMKSPYYKRLKASEVIDRSYLLLDNELDKIRTNLYGNKLVNMYDDGGITNPLTVEELALLKAQLAKGPKSNYEDAIDFDVNPISKLKVLTDKGVSNCMLTASQFYNPQLPISGIRTILANPENNGFYQVNEKYAVPGSLMIASMPGTTDSIQSPRHAMILSGYAENDYDFPFKGQMYHVSKGDPLVNYSRGKRSADEYMKNVPLKAYIDNSSGKTDIRYFRPFNEGFPAKLLPEIIVTPYGNTIQQLNNREISSYAKPSKISPITEEQIQNLMKNINPVSSTKVVTKRR